MNGERAEKKKRKGKIGQAIQGERGENDGHEKPFKILYPQNPQNFSVVYIYVALFNRKEKNESLGQGSPHTQNLTVGTYFQIKNSKITPSQTLGRSWHTFPARQKRRGKTVHDVHRNEFGINMDMS